MRHYDICAEHLYQCDISCARHKHCYQYDGTLTAVDIMTVDIVSVDIAPPHQHHYYPASLTLELHHFLFTSGITIRSIYKHWLTLH